MPWSILCIVANIIFGRVAHPSNDMKKSDYLTTTLNCMHAAGWRQQLNFRLKWNWIFTENCGFSFSQNYLAHHCSSVKWTTVSEWTSGRINQYCVYYFKCHQPLALEPLIFPTANILSEAFFNYHHNLIHINIIALLWLCNHRDEEEIKKKNITTHNNCLTGHGPSWFVIDHSEIVIFLSIFHSVILAFEKLNFAYYYFTRDNSIESIAMW